MSPNFELEEGGEPKLLAEGEKPPEPEQPAGQAPADPNAIVGEWTAQEVAQTLSSLMTGGLMLAYIVRRMELPGAEQLQGLGVSPQELPATSLVFLPAFNRWLPKAYGGTLVAAGASILPAVGEIGVAIGRRAPLLEKKVTPPPYARPPEQSEPPAPEPTAAPAEPMGEDSRFKFPKDFADILPGPGLDLASSPL